MLGFKSNHNVPVNVKAQVEKKIWFLVYYWHGESFKYERINFTDRVLTTLVSLGALKLLKCIPENFPLPPSDVASSLSEKDNEEYEERDEKEVKPRQPTPDRPQELPFPTTEEKVPKLKLWLISNFADSSFKTWSAPLATMMGPPMKIHIDTKADPNAIHKPITIPHHW